MAYRDNKTLFVRTRLTPEKKAGGINSWKQRLRLNTDKPGPGERKIVIHSQANHDCRALNS